MLKVLCSLGVLPIIDYSKLSKEQHLVLRESLEAFVDEVHRSPPTSVTKMSYKSSLMQTR